MEPIASITANKVKLTVKTVVGQNSLNGFCKSKTSNSSEALPNNE